MKKIIIVLMILTIFSACRKVALYHDLSEEEANDILVVLQQQGIDAEKVKEVRQNEVFWTISVDSKRISDARRLLVEHNLPHKKELGLSGVYKEKGMIPTPDEQKARYLLALKGEIINSLTKIPDVVDADVVLSVPTPDEFAKDGDKKRPTASVIVKARPSDAMQENLSEAKIQQFVANSVENLNPRDVSVIITYVSTPKPGLMPGQSLILPTVTTQNVGETTEDKPVTRIAGLEVVGQSQAKLKIYLGIFLLILAVLAIALIVTVIRTSRMRQELKEYRSDSSARPSIEGRVVDERPKLTGGR
jgi:type III secretion protein J